MVLPCPEWCCLDGQRTTGYDTQVKLKDPNMMLLITILAGISVLFGIGLIFSPARGAGIAGVICIGAGVIAYDHRSLLPLAIGFGLLWVLRLLGIEKR
jgi:hypothetical protein